ncbi:VOC family protein [Planococcus shenhongbingii]|uniref:VOC family protein n=1 Tax=Planococcus shenhongbingii TaxID=3058398 RepID=A0ABT8NAW1_9BACL|nr:MULTISPECIES: VOC family protein [unclassified Planococcus (in: firmicutes)]MDN7245026.1 VOC family protein [Planococcus sp. N017]WKA58124.1 VOC family protein [Planococcus sp. N016]
MLHHVEINVSDLDASRKFYSALLSELGYVEYQNWPLGFSYKSGSAYLVFVQTEMHYLQLPYHRKATGLNHLAFHAESRGKVDSLTEKMRRLGVQILYEDRHPYAGGPEHYAVFMEDPDRLKIEIAAAEGGGHFA